MFCSFCSTSEFLEQSKSYVSLSLREEISGPIFRARLADA